MKSCESLSAPWSRRRVLACGPALVGGLGTLGRWAEVAAAPKSPAYPIGICDWNTDSRGTPASLAFAAKAGIEGVQVSFGKPGGKFDLREEQARKAYVEAMARTGTGYASLAMGVLNAVPYATDPNAERWVRECIQVMGKINEEADKLKDADLARRASVSVVLLAFFGKGDIRDPKLMVKVAERLKKIAPLAEKSGVVIGLETWLNVEDHLKILKAVDSPAVQVYYDTANMTKRGYDIHAEIRTLGARRICQVHTKENGALLGKGKVDFPRLKKTLKSVGYRDWLVIESAQPRGMKRLEAHTHNATYLKKLFKGPEA